MVFRARAIRSQAGFIDYLSLPRRGLSGISSGIIWPPATAELASIRSIMTATAYAFLLTSSYDRAVRTMDASSTLALPLREWRGRKTARRRCRMPHR